MKLEERYEELRRRGLSLDMTRGKPCPEQLDLSLPLLELPRPGDYRDASGADCRNYGGLDGIPEAKALFARYLEVGEDEILVGGNASLTLMHDVVARAMSHGASDSPAPWGERPCKFVCPAPGYDRHFAICEHLRIEMLPVEMTPAGPAIDQVEALAASDDTVKGIWIVPRYSNPTGVTLTGELVDRLAALPAAAPDFRILWDNAYAAHHLCEPPDPLKNVLEACKAAGQPDRVLIFGSTSKITFAGAGIALCAGSRTNLDWLRRHLAIQTIGPDKLNQLRHVRFFGDLAGIAAHMRRHAAILKPKFDAVQSVLERELSGTGLATWSRPRGGYFVSLDTPDGCARRTVELASAAGVKLTPAGATFPYRRDPRDRNIRIAPSLPSVAEIEQAMEVVAACIQLAALDRSSSASSATRDIR